MIDCPQAHRTAGGQVHSLPILLVGVLLGAPFTASTQVTGDDSSVLRIRRSGGRIKLFDSCVDLPPDEFVVAETSGEQYEDLDSGDAVWGTYVAFQSRPSGEIQFAWVMGAADLLADAVVATPAEIEAFLQIEGGYVILGDACWYRDAATSIIVYVDHSRRPAYVDDAAKTAHVFKQETYTTLGSRFHSFIEVELDLDVLSALTNGDMAVDKASLPNLPWGGYIGADWEIVVVKAGVGAGASVILKLEANEVVLAGSSLTLAVASALQGAVIEATGAITGNTEKFPQGSTFGIEMDTKANAYTAGVILVRIPVYEYVAE